MADVIALAPFAAAHPPRSGEGAAAPVGHVPDALAELWRAHGPGPYGDRLIRLVDPEVWQPVLDRWIVPPPGETRRVPVALTPFGTLLYHRRLSEADEDVAALDPVERSLAVLGWDLVAFFNETLADADALDALVPSGMLRAAVGTAGPLAPSEVYEVDQTLLAMQMLKITRTDALALHARLREAVDLAAMPDAPPAESLEAALPPEHRAAFTRVRADLTPDADGVGRLFRCPADALRDMASAEDVVARSRLLADFTALTFHPLAAPYAAAPTGDEDGGYAPVLDRVTKTDRRAGREARRARAEQR